MIPHETNRGGFYVICPNVTNKINNGNEIRINVSDDGEGDFASLNDRQMDLLKERFAQPEQFTGFEPDAEPRMRFFAF